jgi:hypothetical protein
LKTENEKINAEVASLKIQLQKAIEQVCKKKFGRVFPVLIPL